MSARAARNQNRHFKTLILLVVSMTLSTSILFWVDQLAPARSPSALRSLTPKARPWRTVAIRQQSEDRPAGFFHVRIDARGRCFQTSAWKYAQPAPDGSDTLHVVLSGVRPGGACTPMQSQSLRKLLGQLHQDFALGSDAVRLVASAP